MNHWHGIATRVSHVVAGRAMANAFMEVSVGSKEGESGAISPLLLLFSYAKALIPARDKGR